jgi:hypothetical protein
MPVASVEIEERVHGQGASEAPDSRVHAGVRRLVRSFLHGSLRMSTEIAHAAHGPILIAVGVREPARVPQSPARFLRSPSTRNLSIDRDAVRGPFATFMQRLCRMWRRACRAAARSSV